MGSTTGNLRIVGLLLVLGAFLSLGLHLLGAPEELYRSLYHQLLSGLDVPRDPSSETVAAVRYTSLIAGVAELAAGIAVLAVDAMRRRRIA